MKIYKTKMPMERYPTTTMPFLLTEYIEIDRERDSPRHSSLLLFFLLFVWAYGAMETHQTSDLRIAGSIPAMLVFLFFPYLLYALAPIPSLYL